jgi:hypothetical protein
MVQFRNHSTLRQLACSHAGEHRAQLFCEGAGVRLALLDVRAQVSGTGLA